MKEVIVPADDLVCLGKEKLQEVIRCKNCRYYNGVVCKKHSAFELDLHDVFMPGDGYCSEAERKEE